MCIKFASTSQSTREAWLNLCAAYWSDIDINELSLFDNK